VEYDLLKGNEKLDHEYKFRLRFVELPLLNRLSRKSQVATDGLRVSSAAKPDEKGAGR
jgi:hypothetical protein